MQRSFTFLVIAVQQFIAQFYQHCLSVIDNDFFSFLCSQKSYCKDQLWPEVQLSGRTCQACEVLDFITSTTKEEKIKSTYVYIPRVSVNLQLVDLVDLAQQAPPGPSHLHRLPVLYLAFYVVLGSELVFPACEACLYPAHGVVVLS